MTLDSSGNITGFDFDPTAAQNAYYSILQFITFHATNKVTRL